ncbi:MAG: ion transporter [Oscillospiraceae bacterium]|nr:ion transporter [Oscillospiraceae bacterium]
MGNNVAAGKKSKKEPFRKKLARIVEIGASDDIFSRGYDFYITGAIIVNLIVSLLLTFDELTASCGGFLDVLEGITVACFLIDYILRIVAAKYIYKKETELSSIVAYVLSFSGIVDLLSFLPNYLPFFFPAGAVAFRMFRVVRIFRLFRITAYYDSLNAISEVITSKKQQLLSSVFIVLVLMLGSSLCMYSVEHEAQPDVFKNAFSGIWWSVSTLLTVGYGDIYPITTLGKLLGTVITFLGVGMVAIPTGIISAGFVEQYSRVQTSATMAREQDIHFIKIRLDARDAWVGKRVSELKLPHGMILTAVHRGNEVIVPNGEVVLEDDDTVVLGSEPLKGSVPITLKELVLLEKNPWNDQCIRDLDISRQTVIVSVRRGNRTIIPDGSTRLRAGDRLLLHSKVPVSGSREITM